MGGECREEISFLFDTLVHELNNVVVADRRIRWPS